MSILSKFNHRESYEFSSMKHGKMMVLHGDQYDVVTSNAKWISKLGGLIYDGLIFINRPLSKYLKNLTKKIVSGVSGFQNLVKKECQNGGYDGLICGHNHRPEILKFSTHVYLNTGDWVESCSAIVEEHNGTIKLINIEESNKINTMAEL
jgi:UDP-2,3-diacylglucosamine pyrophosphatase LpxH